MKPTPRLIGILTATLVIAMIADGATAQFVIPWYTIDGGGIMNSTDGQPDGF